MKKCIAAGFIIAAVIFTCIYTSAFTADFCDALSSSVTACANEANEGNWELAEKHIEEAVLLLDEREYILETFVLHHDLDEIHSLVLKISSAAKLRDTQICVSEAKYLLSRIQLIKEADKLTISNIL